MTAHARTSYDQIPYESYPYAQTHPNRMATVAYLLGHRAPPIDRCRVLELGCANGSNLIPMAATFPHSEYLGIDLSGRQIDDGLRLLRKLALDNISLKRMSVLDVGAELGRFDYIICHGLYSWVTAEVQDKVLAICADNLNEEGLAFVSYNTYPGWHARGMIRDMITYHAGDALQPTARLGKARGLLDFLAESLAREGRPYGQLLRSEVEAIRSKSDSYLFHEYLEDSNEPVYFHEFARRAGDKGLYYLGEVDLGTTVAGFFPAEIEMLLQKMAPDPIRREQYRDLLLNRRFRQTLLWRKASTPTFALKLDRLSALHVSSPARPVEGDSNVGSDVSERFEVPGVTAIDCSEPIVKAALRHLAEVWPRTVPFDDLCDAARAWLSGASSPAHKEQDTQQLGRFLLTAHAKSAGRLVELHLYPPTLVVNIASRPVASRLARAQAETSNTVTNVRHEPVDLDELGRHLIQLLDGKHNMTDFVEAILQLTRAGKLVVEEWGRQVTDEDTLRRLIHIKVEEQLQRLASYALLVG
ncbi:MAG: methyltransferase regulatory domain-containing protein [Gemmataceae bacterium]